MCCTQITRQLVITTLIIGEALLQEHTGSVNCVNFVTMNVCRIRKTIHVSMPTHLSTVYALPTHDKVGLEPKAWCDIHTNRQDYLRAETLFPQKLNLYLHTVIELFVRVCQYHHLRDFPLSSHGPDVDLAVLLHSVNNK